MTGSWNPGPGDRAASTEADPERANRPLEDSEADSRLAVCESSDGAALAAGALDVPDGSGAVVMAAGTPETGREDICASTCAGDDPVGSAEAFEAPRDALRDESAPPPPPCALLRDDL